MPALYDQALGEFYFFAGDGASAAASATPLSVDPETEAWRAAEQLNSIAAIDAYLKEYPQGRYASVARIKLAALREASPDSGRLAYTTPTTAAINPVPSVVQSINVNTSLPANAVGLTSRSRGLSDPSADNCIDCHGAHGESAAPGMPAIAGQSRAAIVQAMKEFKSGQRPSTIMQRIAKGYTDSELDSMGEFFSRQVP